MSIEPWILEIPFLEPATVFHPFSERPWAILLESARTMPHFGRYSFIAVDPFDTYTARQGDGSDPFAYLASCLEKYPQVRHRDLPPFQGGIAGFFSYELARHLEKLPACLEKGQDFPDMAVGLYDVVIAFDHWQSRAWVISSGYPESTADARKRRAQRRGQEVVENILSLPKTLPPISSIVADTVSANFSAESYQSMVQRVIDYIGEGDVFETNVTQCFTAPWPKGLLPFDLYRRLSSYNAAPFASFVNTPETTLISASPERFVQLIDQEVSTFPIKGTRRRGASPEEDAQLADSLRYSEKDWAENTMIVDLMRNDLSRVCKAGTIQVPKLCELESFETVHHLVSKITGRLKEGHTAVDLLKATFPGGSITGAPKIRSMEIISELEGKPRGPYCGSVGYLGFDGSMDTSISIRLFSLKDEIVSFQAGGAIVYDSDLAEEYQESLDKVAALRRVLLGKSS